MINNHSLFWQNKCFSLISRMIGAGGCIFNIFVMLIHALWSCHTAFSVCIRRPLPILATVVNDNLRIALRQKSFFSRDNETTSHKLIQMLLKTPTVVSIPSSLAKQRKVLIQVLSCDHWFCTGSFSSPVQTWCHEECKVLMNVLTALRRSNLFLFCFER